MKWKSLLGGCLLLFAFAVTMPGCGQPDAVLPENPDAAPADDAGEATAPELPKPGGSGGDGS